MKIISFFKPTRLITLTGTALTVLLLQSNVLAQDHPDVGAAGAAPHGSTGGTHGAAGEAPHGSSGGTHGAADGAPHGSSGSTHGAAGGAPHGSAGDAPHGSGSSNNPHS